MFITDTVVFKQIVYTYNIIAEVMLIIFDLSVIVLDKTWRGVVFYRVKSISSFIMKKNVIFNQI